MARGKLLGGKAWSPSLPGPWQHAVLAQRIQHYAILVMKVEKKMATHSSILAWRIPGTEEPGGLPSMGSHRVRHD